MILFSVQFFITLRLEIEYIMKTNPLIQFGNVPITTATLASCLSDVAYPLQKIQLLEADGQIIRLKRGLYVVAHALSRRPYSLPLCANHIYGPSYVSLQWALRHYGLIPERVFMITSVTTKRSRSFSNALGTFSYYQVGSGYFPIGIRSQAEEGVNSLIATPEKALCDTILHDRYVPQQSMKGLIQYLEEDIRFDMDALSDFDVSQVEACASMGRKENILTNLVKLIKRL